MAGNFDPYLSWFDIPIEERPPSYYRLLGLDDFENSPEKIEEAVNQRVEFLQALSMGEHVKDAQSILNEVAAARICLSEPAKKAHYDYRLKHPLPKSSNKSANRTTVADANSSAIQKNVDAPNSSIKTDEVKTSAISTTLKLTIAASVVGIAAIVSAIMYVSSSSSSPVNRATKQRIAKSIGKKSLNSQSLINRNKNASPNLASKTKIKSPTGKKDKPKKSQAPKKTDKPKKQNNL